MTKVPVHISLHYVLPERERDLWNAQDEATKSSWEPMTGKQDEVGEPTEFVASIDESLIPTFSDARNVRYVVPVATAYKQVEEVHWVGKSDITKFQVETATQNYHNVGQIEQVAPSDYITVYFHLDTGASDAVISRLGAESHILGRVNFTGVGRGDDVQDRDGHGSMTLSLLYYEGALVYIYKVLGDDGSGSSSGIVKAIRNAGQIAESMGSQYQFILSGSLGGSPGQKYQPYTDACAYAESKGVLCRWSAGNDGVNKISAPANWGEGRASIAFQREADQRASFSNYASWAGISAQGQDCLMLDSNGDLVRGNGTSFSLPLWNHYTGKVSNVTKVPVFKVHDAEVSSARDSAESVDEESHGVLDVMATVRKILPDSPPISEPPAQLGRMTKSKFAGMDYSELKTLYTNIGTKATGVAGTYKGIDA